jgi:hypothetical protein
VTYAQWFSYTREFLSENAELQAAVCTTRQLYPDHALCFVADSGLDDQKLFAHFRALDSTFIIRVSHEERLVEVYNNRLDRWESTSVGDLIATMPPMLKLEATFQHARTYRTVQVALGWLELRLPGEEHSLWLLALHDPDLDRDMGLLTNRPIGSAEDAQAVFVTWRYRPQIEHTYRLDQEAASMSKTCAFTPSNPCTAFFSWSWSPPLSSTISTRPGSLKPSIGCVRSAANSVLCLIWMVYTPCSPGFALCSSLPPPWPLLALIPFPDLDPLVANHQIQPLYNV